MLRKLSEFFGAFSSFSELSPHDAAATVRRLSETETFGSLAFLTPFSSRCADANVRQVWREEIASFSGSAIMTVEQRRRLADFADQFGLTPLEQFTDACRKYEALFSGFADAEQKCADNKGKVTFSAGLLAAALIVIICW